MLRDDGDGVTTSNILQTVKLFIKVLTRLLKSNSLKWNLNVLFAIPYFILYLYQNTTQQEITLNHLLSFCRECLIVCWLISTLGCTNFEKFNHQTQRSNFPKWQGQMSTFPKVHSAPDTSSGSGLSLALDIAVITQTLERYIRGLWRIFSYFIWCEFFCHQ